jgi:hypothetical protein
MTRGSHRKEHVLPEFSLHGPGQPDIKVMVCNYAEGTSECRKGALCYVANENPGSGGERVELLVRSRGGRWIRKWEARHRLERWRIRTVPPAHPLYEQLIGGSHPTAAAAQDAAARCERIRRMVKRATARALNALRRMLP